MWRLRKRRFPRHRLVAALALLLQMGWTAMVVEQAHSSVAMQRRYHKEYSMLLLVIKAMVHGCFPFLGENQTIGEGQN